MAAVWTFASLLLLGQLRGGSHCEGPATYLSIFTASSLSRYTATVYLDLRGQTTHGLVLSWEGDVSGSDCGLSAWLQAVRIGCDEKDSWQRSRL